MSVTGRCGYCCANPGAAQTIRLTMAAMAQTIRMLTTRRMARFVPVECYDISVSFADHRQQDIRHFAEIKVQRVPARENGGRTVVRIGVRERPHALHRIGRIGKSSSGAIILVVLAAHRECDTITRWHHDRGWPDLYIEFNRLPGNQRPFLVVRVPGSPGLRSIEIELPLRSTQPAEANGHARIVGTDEHHLLALRI